MNIDYAELEIQRARKRNFNHKCSECPHREIHAYEDDTPIGRTPYGWWMGRCDILDVSIQSNKTRPKDCPLKTES